MQLERGLRSFYKSVSTVDQSHCKERYLQSWWIKIPKQGCYVTDSRLIYVTLSWIIELAGTPSTWLSFFPSDQSSINFSLALTITRKDPCAVPLPSFPSSFCHRLIIIWFQYQHMLYQRQQNFLCYRTSICVGHADSYLNVVSYIWSSMTQWTVVVHLVKGWRCACQFILLAFLCMACSMIKHLNMILTSMIVCPHTVYTMV